MTDELQAALLPKTQNQELDIQGAAAARALLKALWTNTPPTLLWASTGSEILTLWANTNLMRTSGTPMLLHNFMVGGPLVVYKKCPLCKRFDVNAYWYTLVSFVKGHVAAAAAAC